MGKKSQARAGLDGLAPGGPNLRAQAAARRRAARVESKKHRKKLTPGSKVAKATPLEELRKERRAAVKDRGKRIADLKAKGALYDPTADAASEHPKPPFRYNISVKKRILFVEVTLHKVPADKIKVEVTESRLKVDTLAFSKKYVLDIPHPEGVKADPKNSGLAEISPSGVLSIKLQLTHIPESVVMKDEAKQKSIESVKHLRFRRNVAGELITGTKKVKASEIMTKKKKREESDDEEAPQDEKKKNKKKKTFVTDKEAALSLIDSISKEEEPKKQERKTVLDHVTDMKAERKERRMEKRAKKQSMETHAAKQIIKSKKSKAKRDAEVALKEVKPLKKPTGKKVQFAS